MIDYTPYVLAVYGIAATVYGILTLKWQRGLKHFEELLSRQDDI